MEKRDIDDIFKQSFENFETKVKPSVWKNIKTGLKWGGIGLFVKFIIQKIGSKTVVGVISSIATVISTILVMNTIKENKDSAENKLSETPPTTNEVIIEQPSATKVQMNIENAPMGEAKVRKERSLLEDESGVEISKKATTKLDKDKIQSLITSISGQSIASISASPVGGAVPLIVSLENTGSGTSNTWVFSDGKEDAEGDRPVHVFEKPGVYTVKLVSRNANGETAIDSVQIEVTGNSSISPIPTLFSPNGDGKADYFAFNGKNMVNMYVEIFDKSGNVLYSWSGHGGRWDGTTPSGKKAKEGTYFYFVEAEGVDGKKYQQKGTINLAR